MRIVTVKAPGGLENLVYAEREVPAAGPGELLVRIRATSLNYHDYFVVAGKLPVADGLIPMSDGAGEVVGVGAGVTGYAVGDAVIATFNSDWVSGRTAPPGIPQVPGDTLDGFACEYAAIPVTALTRAPAGYSHAEAATVACAGVTAWRGLVTEGKVKPGDVVLVQGTGGVSIFALQFAKAAGAIVIATSSSDAKLERLKQIGADHVINYREVPAWGAEARRLTGGRGVDHVIEVGGPDTLEQSITACRAGAHIAVIGVLTGFTASLPVAALMGAQARMSGIRVGSRADQEEMVQALSATGIKPIIDSRYPLDGMADAFRHQEAQRHFGKIVIEI